MCGIVGYIGKKREASFVIDRLKKLEYRGYDSSGIASLSDGELNIVKSTGKIANLETKVGTSLNVGCAIAHTRWATHGKPTENNAHPHSSTNGEWTIVHNGIIENYLDLKKTLKEGTSFPSDTDTSIVAELLEQRGAKTIEGFIDVCKELKGSFALGCINKKQENKKSIYFFLLKARVNQ